MRRRRRTRGVVLGGLFTPHGADRATHYDNGRRWVPILWDGAQRRWC